MEKWFRLAMRIISAFAFFQGFADETADSCVKKSSPLLNRLAPVCQKAPDKLQKSPLFYQSWCPIEVDLSLALDDFRGIYSGSWISSFGAVAAVNLTIPLPFYFSTQLAGSYGLYEWAGRASTPFKNSANFQHQGFITVAAAWQCPGKYGCNAGIAYDWMLNKNFGVFALNPFFDQIRGQFGYLIGGSHEVGVWGTYGIHTAHEESQGIPIKFKGISQINLFWSYHFKTHGFTSLWVGTPYQRGLLYKGGRAGRFIIGAQFSAPVTENLSIDGHGSYMAARGGSGVSPSKNYGADLYVGITYAFGKRRIMQNSYMTLANNTNFMADTNQNF